MVLLLPAPLTTSYMSFMWCYRWCSFFKYQSTHQWHWLQRHLLTVTLTGPKSFINSLSGYSDTHALAPACKSYVHPVQKLTILAGNRQLTLHPSNFTMQNSIPSQTNFDLTRGIILQAWSLHAGFPVYVSLQQSAGLKKVLMPDWTQLKGSPQVAWILQEMDRQKW